MRGGFLHNRPSYFVEDNTINAYIGLTENEFKTRFYNHNNSFKDKRKHYTTELIKHIWKLKENNKK